MRLAAQPCRPPLAPSAPAPEPARNPAASAFVLQFLSAYYLSYPLKVFLASEDLDAFRPLAAVAFLAFVLRQSAHSRSYAPVRVGRRTVAVIWALCAVVAAYYVNSLAFQGEPLLEHSLYKHGVFASVIVLLLCFRRQIGLVPSRSLDWWMTVLSAVTFAAVALNVFVHRIPDAADLNEKYHIGPLLRAGAGYLDPNFLSVNIAALFFTVLMVVDKRSTLRWVNTSLLLAALFLTFSRGALIFIGLALVLLAIRGSASERRLVVFAAAVAAVAGIAMLQAYDASVLFRRFTDSEGASSTSDRLFQYSSALSYLAEHLEVRNVVLGFGGLDFFFRTYGVHLHNYLLATIFEVGLAPAVAVTVCFVHFFRTAETLEAKLYLTFAGLQLMILPNNPDPLYLGFALSLIAVRRRPVPSRRRPAPAVPVPAVP